MKFLRAIRWALMIEIVLTQVMVAIILELFKREKDRQWTNKIRRAFTNKRRIPDVRD